MLAARLHTDPLYRIAPVRRRTACSAGANREHPLAGLGVSLSVQPLRLVPWRS